ncbi:uncharacterized protein L199_007029 [Kwoniella botswanensis]|uniref:uncharacterized protein n=1 Tax=Kwoniella botswanensis TaxID=1268659 RepID=UPI00315CC675
MSFPSGSGDPNDPRTWGWSDSSSTPGGQSQGFGAGIGNDAPAAPPFSTTSAQWHSPPQDHSHAYTPAPNHSDPYWQQGSYQQSAATHQSGFSGPPGHHAYPPQQTYGQPSNWGQPTHGSSYPGPSSPGTAYSYYQSNPHMYWNDGKPSGILAQAVQSTRPAGYTGAWPPKDAASAAIALGAVLNNKKQSSAQSGASGQFNPQGPPGYGSGGFYGSASGYGGPPAGQGW